MMVNIRGYQLMSLRIKPLKESDIQEAFVHWLRLHHPKLWFNHSANEGSYPVQYRVKLKKMGLCPGWPDLELLIGGKIHFMELKMPKGRLSENQKAFQEYCLENGIPHAVPRSLKEAIEIFKEWLSRAEQLP
jgi:hypothetical protein